MKENDEKNCESVVLKMENITSRSNPVCVHMRKLGKSKSYREEHEQFLCEGKKILEEALKCGIDIDIILTTESLEYSFPESTYIYLTHDIIIDSISPLQTSQGLLFVCRFPRKIESDLHTGIHLLLDNIQDPGNVGTIIRSALAFGIDSVILTEGSADIYNPKTLRASMGAIFKQDISKKNLSELTELKKKGVRFIGTSSDGTSLDIKSADLNNSLIILGNEGQGISKKLLSLCDEIVTIPVSPDCESINVAVAASIIMWESIRD